MKIVKTASGKKTIKMSKTEWETIGSDNGWTKKAAVRFDGGSGAPVEGADNEWVKNLSKAQTCLAYTVQINPEKVLDLLGMDGSEFLQRMRQNASAIPTTVLNAMDLSNPANLFS